jgi:hypothetical protein
VQHPAPGRRGLHREVAAGPVTDVGPSCLRLRRQMIGERRAMRPRPGDGCGWWLSALLRLEVVTMASRRLARAASGPGDRRRHPRWQAAMMAAVALAAAGCAGGPPGSAAVVAAHDHVDRLHRRRALRRVRERVGPAGLGAPGRAGDAAAGRGAARYRDQPPRGAPVRPGRSRRAGGRGRRRAHSPGLGGAGVPAPTRWNGRTGGFVRCCRTSSARTRSAGQWRRPPLTGRPSCSPGKKYR